MQTNYSDKAMKMHYDLLYKVNSDLPNVMLETLLKVAISDVTRPECLLLVIGKTLCVLKKITEVECLEFTVENKDKAIDIISKVDIGLLSIVRLNIIDMLMSPDYSAYDISIHLMLDILYYLSYITQDEFDKAYNAGGSND